jgi:hypothetical protein
LGEHFGSRRKKREKEERGRRRRKRGREEETREQEGRSQRGGAKGRKWRMEAGGRSMEGSFSFLSSPLCLTCTLVLQGVDQ